MSQKLFRPLGLILLVVAIPELAYKRILDRDCRRKSSFNRLTEIGHFRLVISEKVRMEINKHPIRINPFKLILDTCAIMTPVRATDEVVITFGEMVLKVFDNGFVVRIQKGRV